MITGDFFPTTIHKTKCNSVNCFKYPEKAAVDYAVGAPNVINKNGVLSGVVYLCPNCFMERAIEDRIDINANYEFKLHGYQFGEKFGQTVIAIDVDGDGYDDLVVGAPLHSTDENVRSSNKSFTNINKIIIKRSKLTF